MAPHISSVRTTSIIGAGAWGTALARLLAMQGMSVRLWAYESEVVKAIRSKRENTFYLSGVTLPNSIQVTGELAESVNSADLLILAVPSHAMHSIISQLQPSLTDPLPLVLATKGIEEGSLHLMSQVVETVLSSSWSPYLTVLTGPSFALEVCQGKPTTILLAGEDADLVTCLQQIFMTPLLRIYAGRDVIGAQIGGALKNVMAIAAGIVDGLELGFNARAALITRGLAEMIRLGVVLGGEISTFYGLSGLGDLVLTCTGPLSRNYTVGMKLGRGLKLDQISSETKTVAEGIRTTRAAVGLANRYAVEMPIARGVFSVLFEGKNPGEAVGDLMSRAAKSETDGVVSTGT